MPDPEYEIRFALRRRFAAPQFATFEELRSSPAGEGRRADMVAVAVWRSMNFSIYGVEIKTHRSDWLREIKQPEKSDAIASYCDYWLVAVSDENIVKPDELPPAWGLLVLNGKQLRQQVKAKPLQPAPLDRAFVASMLRRAHAMTEGAVPKDELEQRIAAERQLAEEQVAERLARADAGSELDNLRRMVRRFEEASGVKLEYDWQMGQVGEAVKVVMAGKVDDVRATVEHLRRYMKDGAEEMVKHLKAIDALMTRDLFS